MADIEKRRKEEQRLRKATRSRGRNEEIRKEEEEQR
jgi:hypothetical protein